MMFLSEIAYYMYDIIFIFWKLLLLSLLLLMEKKSILVFKLDNYLAISVVPASISTFQGSIAILASLERNI